VTGDAWTRRDLPVLRWIVDQFQTTADPDVSGESVATALDLAHDEVELAVQNLERGAYLANITWTFGGFYVGNITEKALRTTGIWPSAENVDALVDALRQAEEAVDDPEEKTLIRRAARAVGSVSRDVMVDVMAAVLARQSGVG
jgi:hypothetical protein